MTRIAVINRTDMNTEQAPTPHEAAPAFGPRSPC
jgi:hypothetical protein